MPKRWHIRPHDSASIARLEREASVSSVVAQLLICRGICDPRVVREFLDPKLTGLRDPDLLPGVPAAADRLLAAAKSGRPIVVYGDYDADGMTATSILLGCLKLLGAEVSFYVPNRIDEGYGLNDEALRTLAQRGAATVVTVDCGITSLGEAATAKELGLELIITDHHEMKSELPDAAAIVHPRLPGHQYPFAGLSGAGVAFKLAWALCQRACQAKKVTEGMRSFLLQAIGLAAIGTVADIVPLVDENRIIVHHGLRSLREWPTLGVAALMKLTKLDQKPCLECEDIGFTIGPRLNAAGRLGQAQLGVELLTTERTDRAAALAEYLHELNGSRDSLERSIYLSANKQIQENFDPENDSALVLAGRGWHAGVIGIVAGRLAEKFHRPVVLIAQDDVGVKPGIGSVRGAPGCSVHEALGRLHRFLAEPRRARRRRRAENRRWPRRCVSRSVLRLRRPANSRRTAHRRTVDRCRNDARRTHHVVRRANRTARSLWRRQSPAAVVCQRRAFGGTAQAHWHKRPSSFAAARSAWRSAPRRGVWQWRLGRRSGERLGSAEFRVSSGDQ